MKPIKYFFYEYLFYHFYFIAIVDIKKNPEYFMIEQQSRTYTCYIDAISTHISTVNVILIKLIYEWFKKKI